MKKLIAIVIILVLLLSIMSVASLTVSALTSGDYEYAFINNGNAVTITGYKGLGGDITIPSMIADVPVINIDVWSFSSCASLTSITIPNGVTNIDRFAFWCCTSLTEVVIPASVISIGASAFESCNSLTTILYGGSQNDRTRMVIETLNNDSLFLATWQYNVSTINGDANGDKSVDMKDVLMIRKSIAGMNSNIDKTMADVDGDGNLSMKDELLSIRTKMYVSGRGRNSPAVLPGNQAGCLRSLRIASISSSVGTLTMPT